MMQLLVSAAVLAVWALVWWVRRRHIEAKRQKRVKSGLIGLIVDESPTLDEKPKRGSVYDSLLH